VARRAFLHVETMKSATANLQGMAEHISTSWPCGTWCGLPGDVPFLALADLLGRDDERAGRGCLGSVRA
jgi:hypothetical protein